MQEKKSESILVRSCRDSRVAISVDDEIIQSPCYLDFMRNSTQNNIFRPLDQFQSQDPVEELPHAPQSSLLEWISFRFTRGNFFLSEEKIASRFGLHSPLPKSCSHQSSGKIYSDEAKAEYRLNSEFLNRTLAIKARKYGPDSPHVALTLIYLARLGLYFEAQYQIFQKDELYDLAKLQMERARKILVKTPLCFIHQMVVSDLNHYSDLSLTPHLVSALLGFEVADALSGAARPYDAVPIRTTLLEELNSAIPQPNLCKAAQHLRLARDLVHNLINITAGTLFALTSVDENLFFGIKLLTHSENGFFPDDPQGAHIQRAVERIESFLPTFSESMQKIRRSLSEFESHRAAFSDELKELNDLYALLRSQELLLMRDYNAALSIAHVEREGIPSSEYLSSLKTSLHKISVLAHRARGCGFPDFEYWCLTLATKLATIGFGEDSAENAKILQLLGHQRRNQSGLTYFKLSHIFPESFNSVIDLELVAESINYFRLASQIYESLRARDSNNLANYEFEHECAQREAENLSEDLRLLQPPKSF